MQIQKLTAGDTAVLEQITTIEQESFTDPWSLQSFVDAANNACTTIWAAVESEQVQGYLVCFYAAGEAEIANIAAAPDCRRMGIGAMLLQTALDAHPDADFFLEVRITNMPARKLYEKFGFQELGIRPDYYENPRENAVIMKREAKISE